MRLFVHRRGQRAGHRRPDRQVALDRRDRSRGLGMSVTVEQSAKSKFRWRVLAPIVLLIILSSLDRVNISFAALQMNADIGIGPEAYGLAVGMFFVGYLLFQFPSTWVLTRFGARRWIAGCVGIWGTVATMMAFVQIGRASCRERV